MTGERGWPGRWGTRQFLLSLVSSNTFHLNSVSDPHVPVTWWLSQVVAGDTRPLVAGCW